MYKRRRTSYKPRRRLRRYTRRRIPRAPRRIGFTGIPQRLHTKLRYADSVSLTVNAGSNAYYYYQNSLFDPYTPAGGHQPMFFDQYGGLYYYYRVYGIGYVFVAQPNSASSNSLTMVTYANQDGNVDGSAMAAMERTGSKFTTCGGSKMGKLKGYVSVAKQWFVPKRVVAIDDSFSAPITGNPTKLVQLFFQYFNPTAANVDVITEVRLTYYCEFFGPRSVSQS